MKVGDLVRNRNAHRSMTTRSMGVFIRWCIVDGEEEGEFYTCAEVLWFSGGRGAILRRNLVEVANESR